jgi:hypothetical protein
MAYGNYGICLPATEPEGCSILATLRAGGSARGGHRGLVPLCGGDSYAMGVREGRAAAIFCLNWNHIDTYLVSDTAEVPSTVLNSLKAATFEDCRADREGVEGGRAS